MVAIDEYSTSANEREEKFPAGGTFCFEKIGDFFWVAILAAGRGPRDLRDAHPRPAARADRQIGQ